MFFIGHQVINEVIGLIVGFLYLELQKIGEKDASKNYVRAPIFLINYCEKLLRVPRGND